VGRNRQLRVRLAGVEKKLSEHEAKIRAELGSPLADPARIKGWQREISAWEKERERILRRLNRDW
jgi:uncharacterized protein (DUF1800 family)